MANKLHILLTAIGLSCAPAMHATVPEAPGGAAPADTVPTLSQVSGTLPADTAATVTPAVEMSLSRGDLTAMMEEYSRLDLNGQPCALVRLWLDQDDVLLDGEVVGDVEHTDGVYFVYLVGGSDFLNINFPDGADPLWVSFRDYGIDAVKPGNTYDLKVARP
ncbi:MAG: hypothetical protein J6L73_04510 [Muribaculaceae bacterium]|nr:hypothetical protein [Muribaculaceae bacterium]